MDDNNNDSDTTDYCVCEWGNYYQQYLYTTVTTRMTQSVIPTDIQKGPGLTLGAIGKSQSSDTFPPMGQRSYKGRTMSCVMEESNLGPEGEQSHKGRTMSCDNSHGSEGEL